MNYLDGLSTHVLFLEEIKEKPMNKGNYCAIAFFFGVVLTLAASPAAALWPCEWCSCVSSCSQQCVLRDPDCVDFWCPPIQTTCGDLQLCVGSANCPDGEAFFATSCTAPLNGTSSGNSLLLPKSPVSTSSF